MGAYTVGEISVKTVVPIKMMQSLYIENHENTHVNLVLAAFIFEDDVCKRQGNSYTGLSVGRDGLGIY